VDKQQQMELEGMCMKFQFQTALLDSQISDSKAPEESIKMTNDSDKWRKYEVA